MRQDAQKAGQKFCGRKTAKKRKTHPEKPEKGETGCVLGAGGGGSGWRRMRADGKGRSEQGRGGRLLLSLAKMEGRTCLACWLGCCSPVGSAQHRPRREPRPVRNRAPLALARPSARGFGVDVGERSRERRRARCHPVPTASPREGGAGLVLRAIFGEGLCIDYHFFLRKKSTSARRMAKQTRITAG